MSRIGKKPVEVPGNVKVSVADRLVTIEGPTGRLTYEHRPEVRVVFEEETKQIIIDRDKDDRLSRAFHGLTRALLQNMVIGVTKGYEKRLEIVGVGYVAAVQNNQLQLRVGFANELQKSIPEGLDVTVNRQEILVKGCDKQKVGQFAAEVRALRKPEPYKGKGIRYKGEHVKIKPGKTAT